MFYSDITITVDWVFKTSNQSIYQDSAIYSILCSDFFIFHSQSDITVIFPETLCSLCDVPVVVTLRRRNWQ